MWMMTRNGMKMKWTCTLDRTTRHLNPETEKTHKVTGYPEVSSGSFRMWVT